ncbi:carcinoembryonic antigen-related cell adhesion molecule 20-like isoform X1 [Stegostoma tigrinum]|uniref:carcinoembryonic antigen-related cell adhesion molecule 20-like isoform X1 n=1 Tax=Stegostoma tigrinum TaxID=3053191 RepID=UPI00202B260B|nr:carcinoembryonic antigen-related cell adhesion molecule 20-like isoform X1 [Stegostoma tigrinum]XP_059495756.1 carcinoembryonic antigen-related cell adhesion molecule 20-like isoform X1 [Stegostoma tigrinum]
MKIYFVLAFLFTQRHLSESKDPIKLVAVAGDSVFFPSPGNKLSSSHAAWIFVTGNCTEIIKFEVAATTITRPAPAYKKRILFYTGLRTFVLMYVQEDDSGIYHYIDNSQKKTISIVHLQVYDHLAEPQLSSNSTLENSIIALTCSTSKSILSVTWLISGFAAHNYRYTLIDDNTTLVIKNAQKSDSGTYTCFVRNPVSEASSSYELTVKYQYILTVAAGSNVTFPGPKNPEKYKTTIWIFHNHISSDVVSFARSSNRYAEARTVTSI